MGNPISKKYNIGGWNMNRKIALFLALSLVSVGLVALFPTAAAQPYGGSVSIGDGTVYKDYFDLWDDVYYDVHATDNGSALQYKDIDIEIIDPTGTSVYNDVIFTDQFGNAQGYWPGTGVPNRYTIYANYTGVNLANTTFRVYDPYPETATVVTYANGYRTSGGTPATYFNSDDDVYFSIYVEDQYGHPFTDDDWPGDRIKIYIEHNDESNRDSWWDDFPGDDSYIDEVYDPSDDFWNLEDRYGSYLINVSNNNDQPIGNTTFIVVDVGISITPDKSKYVQGDVITIVVDTSIEDTIDVRIIDSEGNDLSGANWTGQPISGGVWTKDYTLGGNLPDGDYEVQVLKDGNLMETWTIRLQKFTLKILTDTDAYLPGETMKIYYTITSNKDGSGITDASMQWIFEYFDVDNSEWEIKRDTISSPGPQGMFQISIPKSASKGSDGELWAWANDTHDHTSPIFMDIEIGGIHATVYTIGTEFMAGDYVVVDIEATVNGANLRHGTVAFNVSKDGVEIPAYTVNNLQTDIRGDLIYIFILQSNAEEGFYTIGINITKAGTNEYDTAHYTFLI
jgi:hypothetical protein